MLDGARKCLTHLVLVRIGRPACFIAALDVSDGSICRGRHLASCIVIATACGATLAFDDGDRGCGAEREECKAQGDERLMPALEVNGF